MSFKDLRFPLSIQYFAEGEPAAEDPTAEPTSSNPTEGTGKEPEGKVKEAKYSDEDLNNIIAKQKAKWEKEAEEKVNEAKKLAKMNADQKAEYEAQKKEAELAKREAEINRRELTATAKEELSSRELPLSLADILTYDSAESVKASMDTVEKVFRDAVEKAVNEKLKGTPPTHPNGQGKSGFEFNFTGVRSKDK